MRRKREDRVGQLFDFLVDHPKGVTKHQIAEDQEIAWQEAVHLVRDLRDTLGDVDTINVSCDPQVDDPKGPWLYRLTGTMDGIAGWEGNRVGDTERRIRTMKHVVASIANGTDARTLAGRKARLMRKVFTRLIEDLDEIQTT